MNKKILILCVVIAGALLFWFYRQGQLGKILPWAIILVCPLMHVFMMKGMHHNNESTKENNKKDCH